ncbi:MAG: hypothetical protein AAGE01_03070 [Pseudomonadota bacterium]
MATTNKGSWSIRIGTALLVLAAMFFVLALMMLADPLEGEGRLESLVPGLFFCAVTLIPGVVLLLSGRRKRRTGEFEQTMLGYIRSFDRFSAQELAKRIDRSELEVEQLIARLSTRPDLDLVFHRPDRTWAHRGRISEDHAIVDHCSSCGAHVGQQLILEGERIRCTYCDQVLRAPGAAA